MDNFGLGRYHLYIFKKGIRGWTFYSFDCRKPDVFNQIKKKKSDYEIEKDKLKKEQMIKKEEIVEINDDEERKEIEEELSEIEENIELDEEMIEEDKKWRKKIRVFKSKAPFYKSHSYEDYGDRKVIEEKKGEIELKEGIW